VTTDHLVPPTQALRTASRAHFILCMGLFSRFCIRAPRGAAEAHLHCVRDTNSPVHCAGGRRQKLPEQGRFPYLPTVTPAVERKASLTLVAFMSSSISRVRTVVCPGVLRIDSDARGDERRLAL